MPEGRQRLRHLPSSDCNMMARSRSWRRPRWVVPAPDCKGKEQQLHNRATILTALSQQAMGCTAVAAEECSWNRPPAEGPHSRRFAVSHAVRLTSLITDYWHMVAAQPMSTK
jgi:hypothetical protein